MPQSHEPCPDCVEEGADPPRFKQTHGYCKKHAKRRGLVGTVPPGRPQKPAKASEVEEGWQDDPSVSDDELLELRNKIMKRMLLSPLTGQMERSTLLRILGSWKKGETDSGQAEVLRLADKVFGRDTG